MKTVYWILVFLLSSATTSLSQLPLGAPAPDFELAVISKMDPADPPSDTLKLYEITDQGKGVCLFFMTSWCGPCWTYFDTGILDSVYQEFGPPGLNDTEVIMIEIDDRTNNECLFNLPGCTFGTPRGDWTVAPFDIANLDTLNEPDLDSFYMVEFLPTVYVISPDRRAFALEDRSFDSFESWLEHSFKLTASGSTINTDCGEDGAVVLIVNGGFGQLSYEWSTGETTKDLIAVNAGDYSVTITDENGYTLELGPFTVSGPSDTLGVDTLAIVENTCFGDTSGIIQLQGIGGTGPYMYSWSTGDTTSSISGLSGGMYFLTLTDVNSCEKVFSFELNDPPELTLNAFSFPERCLGMNGSIELAGNGGLPPLNYSIGGAFSFQTIYTGLNAGMYNVSVKDSNDCVVMEQVLVDSIVPPHSNAGPDMMLGCNVDSVVLDGSGSASGSKISYQWDTRDGNILSGDTTLQPVVNAQGEYILFVTDNNSLCIGVDTVLVLPDQSVMADAGPDTVINCIVTEIRLDGTNSSSGPDLEYSWFTFDGNILEGENTLTPLVDEPGAYTLVVTDRVRSCSDTSLVLILDDTAEPTLVIQSPDSLLCNMPIVQLDAKGSSFGPNFMIQWTTANGNIRSGENTLVPEVDQEGTYTLTITNRRNGCVSSESVFVVEFINDPFADFLFQVNMLTVQFNDLSEGDPSGWLWDFGDGNFSAEPSPTHKYAQPGTYRVCLVITNECGQSEYCETITIGSGMALTLAEFNVKDIDCSGDIDGAIDITVTGGFPPYMFNWNNGSNEEDQQGLSGGEYRLTVTDQANATLMASFTVDEPDPLTFESLIITNESASGMDGRISFTVEGGVQPYMFLWSNGSTSDILEGVVAGSYTCTVTDGNDCMVVFGPFEVGKGTTVFTEPSILDLNVFPNPVGDILTLQAVFAESSVWSCRVTNDLGHTIWQSIEVGNRIDRTIDMSSMISGQYFLVLSDENTLVTIKLVKQ